MASENFRWSAATAEFGLCLRHSVHAKAANYDQVLEIAHTAIGKDEFGYRKEMIDLVKLAQELDKPVLAATKE